MISSPSVGSFENVYLRIVNNSPGNGSFSGVRPCRKLFNSVICKILHIQNVKDTIDSFFNHILTHSVHRSEYFQQLPYGHPSVELCISGKVTDIFLNIDTSQFLITSADHQPARCKEVCISPASIRSSVVFPAPFGPSIPRISPASTEREIPSTALKSTFLPFDSVLKNVFTKFSAFNIYPTPLKKYMNQVKHCIATKSTI